MERIDTSPGAPENESKLIGFKGLLIATQAIALLIFFLLCHWLLNYAGGFAWRSNPDLQFNWHPFFMIFGMVILYAQSIMIYRMGRDVHKRKLKLAHAILHGVIFLFALIGAVAVYDFHNLSTPPKPNLYTLHSWIGLTTTLLFGCQYVSGFISFLFPGIKSHLRVLYMPVHIYFGVLGFVFAIASCVIGLNEKAIFKLSGEYGMYPAEGLLINFIGVLLVIFGAFVVYIVTKEEYKRQPRPEDNSLLHRN